MSNSHNLPVSARLGGCPAIRKTDAVNATHPLGELIQAAQDKNGWSTRDLERRAQGLGLDMKHSNFSRLKNQELISIKGAVIHALSDVLQVSVQRVAQAAMASMGVEVQATQPSLEDVVRDSPEFSSRDRKIIQGLVDTIRTLDAATQEEVVGNGNHPTHMIQAGEIPANPKTKKSSFGGLDPDVAHPQTGNMGLHADLAAARMLAESGSIFGSGTPDLAEALAKPSVAALLEAELAGIKSRPVRRQMKERILDLFAELLRLSKENPTSGRKVPYVDPHAHPDADEFGHIPLPANYYDLAADSSRNYGAEEDARGRQRGEETQEEGR